METTGNNNWWTHTQGNQSQHCTPDQLAAVARIEQCEAGCHYCVLGISATATQREVKQAYHKQSLRVHPDKNGYVGAETAFKRVSEAFEVLGDVNRRTTFDQTRYSSQGFKQGDSSLSKSYWASKDDKPQGASQSSKGPEPGLSKSYWASKDDEPQSASRGIKDHHPGLNKSRWA